MEGHGCGRVRVDDVVLDGGLVVSESVVGAWRVGREGGCGVIEGIHVSVLGHGIVAYSSEFFGESTCDMEMCGCKASNECARMNEGKKKEKMFEKRGVQRSMGAMRCEEEEDGRGGHDGDGQPRYEGSFYNRLHTGLRSLLMLALSHHHFYHSFQPSLHGSSTWYITIEPTPQAHLYFTTILAKYFFLNFLL